MGTFFVAYRHDAIYHQCPLESYLGSNSPDKAMTAEASSAWID